MSLYNIDYLIKIKKWKGTLYTKGSITSSIGSLEIKNSSIKGREIRKIQFQFSSRIDSKSELAWQWKSFRLVTVYYIVSGSFTQYWFIFSNFRARRTFTGLQGRQETMDGSDNCLFLFRFLILAFVDPFQDFIFGCFGLNILCLAFWNF